jgi:glycosyltransferase involved in cell wall biosynthesis
MIEKTRHVLQLCHGYAPPFLDVARQYAVLFKNTSYKVTTVYLTGVKDQYVINQSASDEVLFLENSSKDLRGLKLKQIRQLKKIQQTRQFDFVIAHRYKAVYICCHLKGLKVIGVHHAFDDYQRLMRRLFVYRQKKNLFLLGVSNAIRDNLKKALPHFPQENIQTLYNRIDNKTLQGEQLSREQAKRKLKLEEGCFYFVNVGRLHPDKDQTTLIKAFANMAEKYDNVRLMIFGTGRLEKTLKELIVRLDVNDKVIITARSHIAHYLKAFDCFALSSDHEPFGMVLLEAMSAGLPVISTQEGGAGEVVGDSGWLVQQGDSEQLSKLMQTVYLLISTSYKENNSLDKDNNRKEIEKQQQKMSQRIENYFDDQAVAEVFWKIPFVKAITHPVSG